MSKQAIRNLLRWGGLAVAVIGFIMGRAAQTARAFETGRVLLWIGLVMIISGIVLRMFVREP